MFNIMFIIVPIFIGVVFIFTLVLMFSPKARGKLLSKQIKAVKHMADYSKEDLESINTTLGNVGIKSKKNILDANEDILTDMASREANIKKDAIRTTVGAIKEGFESSKVYCKHCGARIDEDSKFCKKCGQKQ